MRELLLAFILSIGFHSAIGQDSAAVTVLSSNAQPPTVGMEGRIEVLLPEAGLIATAPDRRAPMLLRIALTRPHGTLTHYDLRYIGRVPGTYDLRDCLVAAGGAPATNLPPIRVSIAGILPEKHNGWLEQQGLHAPWIFGGYRTVVAAAIALWVVVLIGLLRLGRKPKVQVVTAPAPRPPGFADHLRPLVERAAAGTLTGDEKAVLERLLIGHWQRRLGLRETNSTELIGRLREHPDAGKLLRMLEDWLHRPPGSVQIEVESALAPYRDLPDEQPEEAVR